MIQSWDLTFGTKSEDADYVVGQTWARRGSQVYLVDQVRDRLDYPEQVEARAVSGDNRTRPWAAIHRDYKLTDADGKRWVLVLVEGGGLAQTNHRHPFDRTGQRPVESYS